MSTRTGPINGLPPLASPTVCPNCGGPLSESTKGRYVQLWCPTHGLQGMVNEEQGVTTLLVPRRPQ